MNFKFLGSTAKTRKLVLTSLHARKLVLVSLQIRYTFLTLRAISAPTVFGYEMRLCNYYWLWKHFLPKGGSILCPVSISKVFSRNDGHPKFQRKWDQAERANWIAHVNRAVLSLLWETSSFSSCASLKTLNGDRLSFRWVGNCEWASKYNELLLLNRFWT